MVASLKIVHTISSIAEEASGPSYSVVRLLESLVERNHAVTLAALDWAQIPSPPAFYKPFSLGLGPRRLGRSPSMARWLEQQAAAGEIEVLHTQSLWTMPNVYPGRVAESLSIPYVASPRGTLSMRAMEQGSGIKRAFWPLVQRPALSCVTCFHATALSEYEDIRRRGFRQPVAIIPNGIDVPVPVEKAAVEKRTLLFLGRIHPIKGVDMLLAAWRVLQARYSNWQLKIVGPDSRGHLKQMRRLASELRLERVVFSGPLYGASKWQAYSDADLYVLPTYSENFGMTVAEALAAGIPAVVTQGAPWQGLQTQAAGWWIEIGRDALVGCLEEAMGRSSADLQAMGQRGRDWMVREYSWSHIGRQMEGVYKWLLHGGTRPASVAEN